MPSELLPGGEPSGLLSGLVHGYLGAQSQAAHLRLQQNIDSRDSMVRYLGALAKDPSIPPEHQQWALQKIQEGLQHDVSKKPWEVKLSEMPPVSVQRPGGITNQTLPGGSTPPPGLAQAIQQPQPPPGAGGAATAPANDVGRASNGTVNALGAGGGAGAKPQVQIPQPPPAVGMPIRTLPQNQAVQAPTPPPDQISSGGLHVLTQEDRLKYANAAEANQLNILQQRFPEKSPEELSYFLKHQEFEKPETADLAPGAEMVEKRTGKVIARNEQPKPGAKSGYTYEKGLLKDNATGAELNDQEIASNPAAKAVFDSGQKRDREEEARQDLRDQKKSDAADARQQRTFDNATTQKIEADAIKASATARPMVNILDTQEAYVKGGKFTPRQDLSLIVSAVRAMNPGTVRLPNTELEMEIKAGSYGDRFKRWATTATTGTLPDDQRQDLLGVVQRETTTTATQAADNWKEAFGGKKPLPTHLTKFGLETPKPPPSAGGGAPGGKALTMAQIQQAAHDHGVSVEEAKRQATAAGYHVQ